MRSRSPGGRYPLALALAISLGVSVAGLGCGVLAGAPAEAAPAPQRCTPTAGKEVRLRKIADGLRKSVYQLVGR